MSSQKILESKIQQVKEMSEKIEKAKSFVLVDYRGLTVEQDTKLRKALREAGIDYSVAKNSIISFATRDTDLKDIDKYLEGPTAIALSDVDPVAPSKLLDKFAGEFQALEIKAGVVEGKIFDEKGIKAVASLPSREELVAKVLCGLNSPIYGLVNVLNGNIRGLVVALNAIAEKKQEMAS